MKNEAQIKEKIKEVAAILDVCTSKKRDVIDAILDVLENDLEYEEIEEAYFDENKTDRESYANSAREWLDEDITDEEFSEIYS